MQVKHWVDSFDHASTVIEGFVLSNVLKPLPHAGATMQQLDNPDMNTA